MSTFDLSLISDEEITREYMRRLHARRVSLGQAKGGRPKKLTPCAKCGRRFGTVQMRRHEPGCTGTLRETLTWKQASGAAHRLMTLVKSGRQWNIAVADACLDPGWELHDVEDSDFHPCTIRNFTDVFRAHVRRTN